METASESRSKMVTPAMKRRQSSVSMCAAVAASVLASDAQDEHGTQRQLAMNSGSALVARQVCPAGWNLWCGSSVTMSCGSPTYCPERVLLGMLGTGADVEGRLLDLVAVMTWSSLAPALAQGSQSRLAKPWLSLVGSFNPLVNCATPGFHTCLGG